MRILIVEDDLKIASAIKRGLELKGYAVDAVHDGDDGYSYSKTGNYDLLIFDRMLPGELDGAQICKKLRSEGLNVPILLLTAKGTIGDKVEGLNSGADDYLVKPFSFDELTARVQALLRRPPGRISNKITVKDLILDQNKFEVTRGKETIKLTKKEFNLLEYLMINANQIVTKDMIINHLWNDDADILPNNVEVYIGSLRNKIDKPFKDNPELIHTIRGFGYKIG